MQVKTESSPEYLVARKSRGIAGMTAEEVAEDAEAPALPKRPESAALLLPVLTGVNLRQSIERAIVRKLIETATAAGWTLIGAHDGEEHHKRATTVDEAIEVVFSVDESTVYFSNASGHRAWVFIVLGNDGWDCINDYTANDDFEREVMESVNDFAEHLDTRN